MHYEDNSGSLDIDVVAGSHVLAIDLELPVVAKERWEMFIGLRPGVSFNNVQLKTRLEVGNETDRSTERLFSSNLMLSPGFGGRIFYRNFFLQPSMYYSLQLARGTLKFRENEVEVNGEKLKSDPAGLRLGLSVGYRVTSL